MLLTLLVLVLKGCCCRNLLCCSVREPVITSTSLCRPCLVECWKVVLVEAAQWSATAKRGGHSAGACLRCIAGQGIVETTETGRATLLTLTSLLAPTQCREIAEI